MSTVDSESGPGNTNGSRNIRAIFALPFRNQVSPVFARPERLVRANQQFGVHLKHRPTMSWHNFDARHVSQVAVLVANGSIGPRSADQLAAVSSWRACNRKWSSKQRMGSKCACRLVTELSGPTGSNALVEPSRRRLFSSSRST